MSWSRRGYDGDSSFGLLGSSGDSWALLVCFAAWRIRLWHAAVRCHSDVYSDAYSDASSDASSGESFCTNSAKCVGVIIYNIQAQKSALFFLLDNAKRRSCQVEGMYGDSRICYSIEWEDGR